MGDKHGPNRFDRYVEIHETAMRKQHVNHEPRPDTTKADDRFRTLTALEALLLAEEIDLARTVLSRVGGTEADAARMRAIGALLDAISALKSMLSRSAP